MRYWRGRVPLPRRACATTPSRAQFADGQQVLLAVVLSRKKKRNGSWSRLGPFAGGNKATWITDLILLPQPRRRPGSRARRTQAATKPRVRSDPIALPTMKVRTRYTGFTWYAIPIRSAGNELPFVRARSPERSDSASRRAMLQLQ